MVLRLNGTDSVLPGANRCFEFSIWQATSKHGIAPSVLHIDEQDGWLVSAYVNNKLLPKPPVNERYVNQAIALLKRCHQLDIETPIIDYINHIEYYWQIIENKNLLLNPVLKKQRRPMRLMLEELVNSGLETGLCHHDPVMSNFVGNLDRLYLIDWEYARHGLLIMDFAGLAVEWKIDNTSIINHTGIQPELLSMAKTLYRYVCELWEEVTARLT